MVAGSSKAGDRFYHDDAGRKCIAADALVKTAQSFVRIPDIFPVLQCRASNVYRCYRHLRLFMPVKQVRWTGAALCSDECTVGAPLRRPALMRHCSSISSPAHKKSCARESSK
jgi:hypothetical protein